MSTAESTIRNEICEIGKLLYSKGMVAGTEGNISCRLANGEILITPAGACKGMLTPDKLVLISEAGAPFDKSAKPSSEFRLHLHGYAARKDFNAVVHAHAPHATAFALAGLPLDGVGLPEFAASFTEIPLIPFAEPGTQELAEAIDPWIRKCHTFLLERHGIIAFGKDVREAYYRVEMAEHCARIVWLSRILQDASADDIAIFASKGTRKKTRKRDV